MPDTSPNVPVPGAPTSREASAQAAAVDDTAADAVVPELSGALFATEDLRGAVASFLTEGPGKATYAGR